MEGNTIAFMKIIISFVAAFLITLVGVPKLIPILHRLKFGQVEREEGPQSHQVKNGTPTMGGIVFVGATILAVVIGNYKTLFDPTVLLISFGFVSMALIGLLDDWLIVVKKNNEGLKPLYKYLLQSVVAICFYILAKHYLPNFSTELTIPLTDLTIDLGWFYPVLVYFMFTATSNGVNLSDGLDGLATGLSMMAIAPFVIFALMMKSTSISSFGMACIGALLGFMFYNYHPARIFMGDVGSLALGGLLAALAIVTKQELLLILVGGVFVIETLSVMIQVISFKIRKKRVFLMAPLHHHYELKGYHEQQVVLGFWFVGFVCGVLGSVLGVM